MPATDDPREFLASVMNSAKADARSRLDAAKALMAYTHTKKGEVGKKDERRQAAERAAGGRFAPGSAPRLALVSRRA